MTKSTFNSAKVMKQYFSAMLTEDEAPEVAVKEAEPKAEEKLKPVEKLLEKVSVVETKQPEARKEQTITTHEPTEPVKVPEPEIVQPPVVEKPVTRVVENESELVLPEITVDEKSYRQGEFQALFFKVAGLTVAVPLTELGGIHNMGKLNNIFGKPDWFKGVMVHREEKLNVVDTARWVMPEKFTEELEASLDYQYLIMLKDSPWGLSCEQLVNTVTLTQDDVKWREASGKRPWLAGLIKEKMCALLDVDSLIALLEQGLGSHDS